MIDKLRRWLPAPETLQRSRWLRWLGPALHRPQLWHLRRRSTALGTAIGMFFGVLLPLGQIPTSVAVAVLLRANIPAAAAATLVTNPVTTPPLYYAAWRLGRAVLRGHVGRPHAAATAARRGLQQVGKPLALGLAICASVLALAAYAAVRGVWRARVVWRWRRRVWHRMPARRPGAPAV